MLRAEGYEMKFSLLPKAERKQKDNDWRKEYAI